MIDREKVIRAWEIFRNSNPYKICSGREFRAIREPEYCMSQMIEDTITLLKNQEAVAPGLTQTPDGLYASCGKCKANLWRIMGLEFRVSPDDMPRFCPKCGQEVKWND